MVKLIDKAIVINGKIHVHKNKKKKGFIQAIKKVLLRQKNHGKNPKSKNIQTDASCTKFVFVSEGEVKSPYFCKCGEP